VKILGMMLLVLFVAGCAELPIRDGELAMDANTSATLDDAGVARIKNKF